MRHAERVTRRACSKHGVGGATSPLRIGPIGIEPEPQGDADRVRQGFHQRNRAVDAAAHRNSNPPRQPRRPKHRPDRIGQGINRKRFTANSGSLEQSQPNERTIETRSISLDNPIAIDANTNKRELSAPRGISNQLDHRFRLAPIAASAGSAGARRNG
jgi:hypothetical protein